MRPRELVITMLVTVLLAGCDGASTPPLPPAGSTAPASAPGAASAPPSSAPTSALPASQTRAPTAAWLRPLSGATHERYQIQLSVDAPDVATAARVTFRVSWRGGAAQACVAAEGVDSRWSCQAELLALGVPPGALRFDFSMVLPDGEVVASPGDREVTYAVSPPKPANPRWKEIGTRRGVERWEVIHTYRVRWEAPAGYADEFLVYGTWDCPRYSKRNDGTPCFVAGMPVDVSKLELLAKATDDARSVKVRLTEDTGGCNPGSFEAGYYNAVLLRARNAHGNSAFAIAYSATVDWIPPDAVVC